RSPGRSTPPCPRCEPCSVGPSVESGMTVSAGRSLISSPREIQLPSVLTPPKMLLQQSYRPSGVAFGPPEPGRYLRAFPGYLELACLTNHDFYLVTYIVPVEEEVNLLLACIGETFDPFFDCATGAD